jgi:hypothetical protein
MQISNNSVLLDGSSSAPGGTSALCLGQNVQRVSIRNNILVNLVQPSADGSNGLNTAMRFNEGLAAVTAVDYNDLFVGPHSASRLVAAQSLTFESLSKWKLMGFDAHSVSVNPVFTAPHLHIDTTASVNATLAHAGVSIPGLDFDFDGDRRPAIPDIGADQFSTDTTSTDVEEEIDVPEAFALEQNYPNPFNPSTTLNFELSTMSHVDLRVFDLLGREVAVLVNEERMPGTYAATWNASGCASGAYFYTLRAGEFRETKRMILVK